VWARANPVHFGNLTSHAPGGATEFGLLAVGFFVWVHANPAQFGNLTSHATGGVSEVGLPTVGLSVWVRAYTVWEPDFSCGRCCLGSWAPSSWILCVGNPAQFGNLTSRATGGVSEVGLLAVGLSVWVHANPARFGNLTSHATGGVSEVGLLAVRPWAPSSHTRHLYYHCYLLFVAFGLLFNILINTLMCTFLAIGFLFSKGLPTSKFELRCCLERRPPRSYAVVRKREERLRPLP